MVYMSVKRSFVSHLFYYSFDLAVVMIFTYLFWIAMGKLLAPAEYGIITDIIALYYVVLTFTTFGLHEVLPKFVPEFLKKGLKDKSNSLIIYALKFSFVLSIIFSILIFIFADKLSSIIYNSTEMIQPLQFFSLLLFSGTLMTIFKAILQSLKKFKEMFAVDLVGNIVRIILAIFLVVFGLKYVGGLSSWIAYFFIFIVLTFFILGKIKVRKHVVDKDNVMKFGFFSLVFAFSYYMLLQGGVILLGIMSSMTSVAYFGVAMIFGQAMLFLPGAVLGPLFPNISELLVREKEKAKKLLSLSIKYVTIVSLPLAIVLLLFPNFIVKTFYSDAYIEAGNLFLPLVIGNFLFGMSNIFLIVLYSAYKPHTRTAIVFFGMLASVLLSIFLIPQYNSIGASYAFLISQVLIFVFSFFAMKRVISFEMPRNFLLIFLSNFALLVVLLLTTFVDSILFGALLFVLGFVFYFLSMFLFKIINRSDVVIIKKIPKSLNFLKSFFIGMVERFNK